MNSKIDHTKGSWKASLCGKTRNYLEVSNNRDRGNICKTNGSKNEGCFQGERRPYQIKIKYVFLLCVNTRVIQDCLVVSVYLPKLVLKMFLTDSKIIFVFSLYYNRRSNKFCVHVYLYNCNFKVKAYNRPY